MFIKNKVAHRCILTLHICPYGLIVAVALTRVPSLITSSRETSSSTFNATTYTTTQVSRRVIHIATRINQRPRFFTAQDDLPDDILYVYFYNSFTSLAIGQILQYSLYTLQRTMQNMIIL